MAYYNNKFSGSLRDRIRRNIKYSTGLLKNTYPLFIGILISLVIPIHYSLFMVFGASLYKGYKIFYSAKEEVKNKPKALPEPGNLTTEPNNKLSQYTNLLNLPEITPESQDQKLKNIIERLEKLEESLFIEKNTKTNNTQYLIFGCASDLKNKMGTNDIKAFLTEISGRLEQLKDNKSHNKSAQEIIKDIDEYLQNHASRGNSLT